MWRWNKARQVGVCSRACLTCVSSEASLGQPTQLHCACMVCKGSCPETNARALISSLQHVGADTRTCCRLLAPVQAYDHAYEVIQCYRWLPMGTEVLVQVRGSMHTSSCVRILCMTSSCTICTMSSCTRRPCACLSMLEAGVWVQTPMLHLVSKRPAGASLWCMQRALG